jgi:copper chaperone CopZ
MNDRALEKATIEIEGMHCGNCQRYITGLLADTEGVLEHKVDFKEGLAEITFSPQVIGLDEIVELINQTDSYKVKSAAMDDDRD